MPFDNSTYETKPDVFSLNSLIAWLETQEPEKQYCYEACGGCLLWHYFRAAGYQKVLVGGFTVNLDREHDLRLPIDFDAISRGTPRTYVAALTRAKALRDGKS